MFQSILARLVARAGARWAMIISNDGVLLETDCRSFHTEAEGLAAVYGVCYRAARKAAGETEMGGLHRSALVTDHGKILFQTLTTEYFLILLLEPKAHAGRAFFEMSRFIEPLEQELAS